MKFILALGLIFSRAQTLLLGESTLSQDDCVIKLRHPRNANAFATGPNFLQIGHGNVDDITLIKNGDIQNFPEALTYSTSQVCTPL